MENRVMQRKQTGSLELPVSFLEEVCYTYSEYF